MKLATDIKPRKSGDVSITVPTIGDTQESKYVFTANPDGQLVAYIPHESHIGYLLDTGNFYPADDADIDTGIKVVDAHVPRRYTKRKKL